MSFAGDVAFGEGAALEIELGGMLPGSRHDQISVAGELALDGLLRVTLINGFTPTSASQFTILDWGSLRGSFSALNLPTLGGGLSWNTSQLYTVGVLSVSPGLTADFDQDNDVDGADFLIWQRHAGAPGDLGQGDANGDGNVTAADLEIWKQQFGSASIAPTSAVPEPASPLLALAGSVMACLRRRRRQTRFSRTR